jgi:transposase-like protein
VDEVFCFRGQQKLYLYRAVDEHGQVIDVLLRDKRDRASAEAFFRQALYGFRMMIIHSLVV